MASEAKHTRGPWDYGERGQSFAVFTRQPVKQHICRIDTGLTNQEANARLIAAAPSLYDGAEVALDALRIAADLIAMQFPDHIAESSCIELARRELTAAITKATAA